LIELDPVATRAGARLAWHETLTSTNQEALARARCGERGPLWIAAESQTAGRGRRGRTWVSEPGNLYATLLLIDPSAAERAAELSFVAALALHDALVAAVPGVASRLAFKWPNDLLLDGGKLAGILVEGERSADGLAVAVGIGVNCARHPSATSYPATDLATAGISFPPSRLLTVLSRTMVERLALWRGGNGFAAIRADWVGRAAGLGREALVVSGEEELSGRFDGVDEGGHLILRLGDGTTRTITAGDVVPLLQPSVVGPAA